MHSRFTQRIAENIAAYKQTAGAKAAQEYAQRTCDNVSEQEWKELLKAVKAIKKAPRE